MYIRTKKSSRNTHVAVQLVESYRANDKIHQRVVRHIGTAKSEEELIQLRQVAFAIKSELISEVSASPTVKAKQGYAQHIGSMSTVKEDERLHLSHTMERSRLILGIHDVYGYVYDVLGFSNPFSNPTRRTVAANILKEVVLARIAKPTSKRGSVELLAQQFGVQLNLDNVYQMMDKIDTKFCERIQKSAMESALRLAGEKLNVLFYDATTLYFESFTEDSLKQNGYSKDLKFNQPQVLLTLFVTDKGLPVGYEIFPGATFEGHTLIPILEQLKSRYQLDEIVLVADRGMLNKDNIEYLNKNKIYYIVGSRLKTLKQPLKKQLLDWSNTIDKEHEELESYHELILENEQKIVLSYKPARAKKDRADREKAIQKLQNRLKRSKNPKQLVSNYGFQKFIRVEGEAKLIIDEEKLQSESVWDGITGIQTNHPTMTAKEIFSQYRGLWQVEESFRITKHDLRVRPIYHWTPKRVRAHLAIAFMAFSCVRYLEYRVTSQSKKLSPEVIRQSLLASQASILYDAKLNTSYLLPAALNSLTKELYRIIGIKLPTGVMKLNHSM